MAADKWWQWVFDGVGIFVLSTLGGIAVWLYRRFSRPKKAQVAEPKTPEMQSDSTVTANHPQIALHYWLHLATSAVPRSPSSLVVRIANLSTIPVLIKKGIFRFGREYSIESNLLIPAEKEGMIDFPSGCLAGKSGEIPVAIKLSYLAAGTQGETPYESFKIEIRNDQVVDFSGQFGNETETVQAQIDSPKLHFLPEPELCFWGKGMHGTTPMMQMIVCGYFSIEHKRRDEGLVLLQAFIRGTRPMLSLYEPLRVEPGMVTQTRRLDFFVAPIIAKDGEDFVGKVIFVDQFKREHKTDEITFKAVQPKTIS